MNEKQLTALGDEEVARFYRATRYVCVWCGLRSPDPLAPHARTCEARAKLDVRSLLEDAKRTSFTLGDLYVRCSEEVSRG